MLENLKTKLGSSIYLYMLEVIIDRLVRTIEGLVCLLSTEITHPVCIHYFCSKQNLNQVTNELAKDHLVHRGHLFEDIG